MAIDLRIQNFAMDTFLRVEKLAGIPNLLFQRWEEYKYIEGNYSTIEIQNLILCRYQFFGFKLMELEKDLHLYKDNDVDFYIYIQENMSRYFPYPDMNVFDKLSMSCAVVLKMSHLLYLNGMYRDTTPISWAMYFEALLKEEFDIAGSWISFKNYAKKKATGVILKSEVFRVPPNTFQTDLERVHHLYKESERLYYFDNIFETFRKCVNHLIGVFYCRKCLPLFNVFFWLCFGRKLFTDFELLEGYLQIFLRMWFENNTEEMWGHIANRLNVRDDTIYRNPAYLEIRCNINKLFYNRIFMITSVKSKEDDDVADSCVFCGDDKKVRSDWYLKSIIHKTVSDCYFDFLNKFFRSY